MRCLFSFKRLRTSLSIVCAKLLCNSAIALVLSRSLYLFDAAFTISGSLSYTAGNEQHILEAIFFLDELIAFCEWYGNSGRLIDLEHPLFQSTQRASTYLFGQFLASLEFGMACRCKVVDQGLVNVAILAISSEYCSYVVNISTWRVIRRAYVRQNVGASLRCSACWRWRLKMMTCAISLDSRAKTWFEKEIVIRPPSRSSHSSDTIGI